VRRGQQNQRLLDTGLRRYDGFFEVFHVFQHPARCSVPFFQVALQSAVRQARNAKPVHSSRSKTRIPLDFVRAALAGFYVALAIFAAY
jgi:hypothetical protein